MSKPTVAFIEPAGGESNVFENYMRLPLMGTLYLGTILDEAGYPVRIYNENVMPHRIDPFDIDADVYCISALTVSSTRAHLLALEFRRIRPDARIIVGGIHASLLPETFVDVADHVVYGEAEGIIVDLVEGRFTEKMVSGSPVEDLDAMPLVNYSLLEHAESMDIIPIMTSRGCPFDCNFCCVTRIFGKRFRMQSPERIVAEVRQALEFFGNRFVFFYDDNFTANPKRVERFCELVEEEGIEFSWSAQVRSDVARRPEMVEQMERAGCRQFYIGFESINDETLKAMHKSQTRADIERAIEVIRARGVQIHGMFILGEDHETPESIDATVDFAIRHHIDTVQFTILTPFPGTRLYDDIVAQDRLIHTRWNYFDGMFVVFRPHNMSPARLQRKAIEAYRRFYSLRRVSLEGLRLLLDVTLDALTWNFRRAFYHTFDSLFLEAGGWFIVGRSADRVYRPYAEFLESNAHKHVAPGEISAEDVVESGVGRH